MGLRRGTEVELEVEDIAFGGKGIARLDGLVIFVEGALPGEQVRARIRRRKSDYAEATVREILSPSPRRVVPRCEYFGICGGCKWQNVPYEEQLDFKWREVRDSFNRIGGFREVTIERPLPSPEIFFYRNKMEFAFSRQRWLIPEERGTDEKPKDFALGLHVPGRFDKVLDLDRCYLQSELSNRILQATRDFARTRDLEPWDTRTHSGFWRYLVVREGKNTGEVMVNLVTSRREEGVMRELAEVLCNLSPKVVSVVNNIQPRPSSTAFGEEEWVVWGRGFIVERLGPFSFEISANSFFQTNTRQAERLYRKIVELAELEGRELVYDLYCGTGTIGIFLSPHARRVLGVELLDNAVANARRNCERNKVTNCTFLKGDVAELLTLESRRGELREPPDVLVVDPPRAGVHPKGLRHILALQPRRIIYVSCNPTTLARDLKVLCERRYQIKRILPVDMFPHTYHIETIVRLDRKAS